jgi:hypothetical protein
MSGRTLLLLVLLLALALWLWKVTADAPVTSSDGSGDPTGLGALWESVNSNTSTVDSTMTKSGATLKDFAQAIYDFEDPSKSGIATRNNNPGNLVYVGQRGATKDPNSKFAVFSTLQDGFDALLGQLQRNVSRNPDYSLLQDRAQYLGGDPSNPKTTGEGNPAAYAQFIAGRLGTTVNATLGQLFGGNS